MELGKAIRPRQARIWISSEIYWPNLRPCMCSLKEVRIPESEDPHEMLCHSDKV